MYKIIFCFLLLIISTNITNAQTDSTNIAAAKIYIIRNTGHIGSAINFRVFMDSLVVCKISNKHYSVIDVAAGNHLFYVTTWDMPNPKQKFGLNITIEAGKEYFLKMNVKSRFLTNEITFDEITSNSAKPLLEKLKPDNNCSK